MQTRARRGRSSGVADWLHTTRGKQAWKYIADLYARAAALPGDQRHLHDQGPARPASWRGATLIALGLAVPVGYVVLAGGPGAQKTERVAERPGEVEPAPGRRDARAAASARPAAGSAQDDGVTRLPPDDPADQPATR